ncbi:MAG TPA: AgmX/PglI C-terminal domain-containing protein [Polyangia bacterium]|nr:AgmX/PglI C-terminal domain-containing protein [Polyangia bacterium]
MRGFVLGLVVAALVFGGYLYWKHREAAERAAATSAEAAAGGREAARERKKKKRRGATRLARIGDDSGGGAGSGEARARRAAPPPPSIAAGEPEPEPVKLGPADLKMVAQGDDLSRPDVVHLDMSDDSGSRELDQDEIDSRFRAKEEAILTCISRARPDEETYVPGRVTVKFRIQRAGSVRGVRVEAPAILQRGGLTGCIRGVVGALRFPPSNGSQIVTYPFSLS